MNNPAKNSQKRALILSLTYFPRFIGGAEVAIKEITDRLPDFEFDMVTLRGDKSSPLFERIGNVNIYRIGGSNLTLSKYGMLLTGFLKARELHKKNNYCFLWSMMASYNSFAALFFKLFNPSVPFLLTLQEGDPIPYIKRRALPLWPIFKMIFTRADYIQTISNYLGDFARDMGARCPITVVPNGVDFAKFSTIASEDKKQMFCQKIGRKDGDVFLVTASRLVTKNAIGDVIRSLQFLPANIKFAIAGIGNEEKMLREEVARLNLGSRVVFLGNISHGDLPALLQVCNIFVRPSLSEGFGNSFVEAMASKIPVIATPVGGIIDFLKNRETGFLAEPKNPESIAREVKYILENPEKVSQVVESAHKMVKEKYDWNIVASQMKNIFEKLANFE